MKAMILAAGKGTRVRPLTNVLPKPMIPLIRKPIMEAIIDHLKRHAFDEIYVNTSYLSRSIEDYFRDGDRLGVAIAYSYEGELIDGEFIDQPLGSAGGMRRIQDRCGFFDDSFAVLCGDALIDVDLTEVLRFHRASGAIDLNDADLNWLIDDARKSETNDTAHEDLRASMNVTALS